MLRKFSCFLLSFAFLLSACHSQLYNQTEGNIADAKIHAQQERRKFDRALKTPPALLIKKGSYVDLTPISIDRNPHWLNNRIIIRGDQLPFSYYSRTIAAGAGSQVLVKYQSELDPAVNVSLNYTGTIKGALDLLATKTGYVYNVKNKQVYWQAYITKTFDIAFMPGGTDYVMGKKTGSSGGAAQAASGYLGQTFTSADASDGEYSNLSAKLSLWRDLEATIGKMLSLKGSVVVSEATTSLTVRDLPTNVQIVEQYIRSINKNLSRQVLVKIQILQVALDDAFNYGIDWTYVQKMFNTTDFSLSANLGKELPLSQTISGSPTFPMIGVISNRSNNKALIQALNQQGKTSVVTEPRVMCTNNQVSVVRLVTQQAYVASVQNTTSEIAQGNSVQTQVTPGTLIYGTTLYLLPKIMNDSVYLQVNADLSTLDSLTSFNTSPTTTAANSPVNPNNVQIQLPTVSQKHFNQRSLIRSGETLVLAGFRELSNTANAQQLFRSQALGGKGAEASNVETIILITPVIMGTV
jgi:MSHA biogenesis protein MshL